MDYEWGILEWTNKVIVGTLQTGVCYAGSKLRGSHHLKSVETRGIITYLNNIFSPINLAHPVKCNSEQNG